LETDHYRCPIRFALLGGWSGMCLQELYVLRNFERKGGEKTSWV